jgi:predicted MFS family arabinose efflux permease
LGKDLLKPASSETTADQNKSVTPNVDTRLAWIMAVASGMSVANLYYIQPVLPDMARSFAVAPGQIGFIATLSQVGFALGLLFLVPLGDRYNRRTLIIGTLLAVAMALVVMASAPTITVLAIAALVVGVTTVVPQMIVPYAASLARPHERGRIVGIVMSGLLIGVLLARTFSGLISAHLGWRAVYWIAAGLMLLLAGLVRILLPNDYPHSPISYGQLLRSLWSLFRAEPVVREAGVFGALAFGAFSAFWVTLAFFLETPPYHYGSDVAGLFGLVGVVGALAASFVGRMADRRDARQTTGVAIAIILLSFLIFWLIGQYLWGLIIGVILLDLGSQAAHVSNQTRVYSLNPEARNRLNTIYMVPYFIGGALGSALGTLGWELAGWNGVSAVGCIMGIAALAVFVVNGRRSIVRIKQL